MSGSGAEDVLHIGRSFSSVFIFFSLDGGVRIEVVAGTARLLDLLWGITEPSGAKYSNSLWNFSQVSVPLRVTG